MTDDLDLALLADGPDLGDEEARERFRITDDDLASWAIRKLDFAGKEKARIEQACHAEIERIRAHMERAIAGPDHDISFFTARLVEYRRDLELLDPKLPKTYRVATGAISRKAGRKSTKVTDQDAFTQWALDHTPAALEYVPRVSALTGWPRTEDGRVIDPESGEIVPGVETVTGEDSYSVKPAVIGSEF